MAFTAISSILVCALALTATTVQSEIIYADPINSRRLAAASNFSDSILTADDDSGASTVYQEASSTFGNTYSFPLAVQGWSVANLTATLELDAAATYASNFQIDKPGTWRQGTTRFNITVNLTRSGSAISGNYYPPTVSARLHTADCTSSDLGESLLSSDSSGNETSSYAAALGLNLTASGNNLSNSTIYPFLVDYDEVMSVVIYGNGMMLGCRNLKPPFPDFPDDWSSTIEITDVDRGFTFVMREVYSQTLNKVRLELHSFGSDRILLVDPAAGQTTSITPSNGSCTALTSSRQIGWITQDDNSTLLSTAELLRFTANQSIDFVPGFADVRGIPCEVWKTHVETNYTNFTASFDVEYYFPVNQWLVARESYHRMLKRVYINGTRNGRAWESYIEYVNFRPRALTPITFNLCAVSPYGAGCNCTDSLRKAAFANITALAEASEGSDISVDNAASATSQYSTQSPTGFISSQAGPYVGLTIIGLVAGSLITWLAMYVYYRKRVGVRITDNLGHQRFVDGEPSA